MEHSFDRIRDGAADQHGAAGGHRAISWRVARGVAADNCNGAFRDAEPPRDQPTEHGRVALAVRRCANPDLDPIASPKGDCRGLVEDAARNFEIAADPDAAPPAALLRLPASRSEAFVIGRIERHCQHRREIAAVIGGPGGGHIRNGFRADQVAAPQFGGVKAAHPRRLVHDSFEEIIRLRPAGAAIGTGRHRVGEHRLHIDDHARDRIHAGQATGDVNGRAEQRDPGQECAHPGEPGDPQCQKPAVAVKREFGVPERVAGLIVGDKGLAARGDPVDRTAHQLGGTQQRHIFRVARRLHAEATADVVGQHPDLIGRQAERAAELAAHARNALSAAAQGEGARRRIVARGDTARLHRDHGNSLID